VTGSEAVLERRPAALDRSLRDRERASPRKQRERAPVERLPPRLLTDLLLLALLAGAVIAVLAPLQTVRPYMVLAAACLVPGGAILTALAVGERLTYFALAVGFSFAVEIAGALALAWSHWWQPDVLGLFLVLGSAPLLVRDVARSGAIGAARLRAARTLASVHPPHARSALVAMPLVAGVALWAASLPHIHAHGLGRYGLPPALPPSWYAALALLICGAVAATWTARPRPVLIGAYVLALVVVLYATVPAITPVPHYPWVYKHIGVTRSIMAHGGVNAAGDIYDRWPGFFAATAAFSSWAHVDPLAFAAWAEPFFAGLDALLLAAIAFAIADDWRVAGCASLMFTLGNWIGQSYFAPQAMAFTLTLALVLVFVRTLSNGAGLAAISDALERVFHRRQKPVALAAALPWSRGVSVAVVLGFDAVIVATHQLTPYILLLQIGALTLLGIARPRWVVLAMAALTVAYLLPNLGYISRNFGIFTSLNPTSNVKGQEWAKVHVAWLYANAGGLLSLTLIALMLASALRLARGGMGLRAVPLLVLAIAPFGILFAQNYGGEASLRVFLFSSPWRDVLIALGIATVMRPRVRAAAALVVALVLAALFVPAFYGAEDTKIMPRGEVAASEYFYAHAPPGATLILAAEDFPTRVGARYAAMRPQADPPPLTGPGNETDAFLHRPLGAAQIPAIAAVIHQYSREGFLVFCETGYYYAAVHALTPPGALQRLEAAVASSPQFRLWYLSADTRIYQLVS
jgi:hypothetical protein